MASREQQNYEDTKNFLYSHRSYKIANLGYTCLELKDMRFLVICDVRELEMTLQRVVSFLQNLEHYLAVNRLNQAIDNQAKDLVDDLKNLIVLELDDFPIDQNALDLFSPVIRTGQSLMPYRHLVTVDSICICVGNGQLWINGS
ncbi:MAG: hypothetical protein NXY57DRAFT_1043913 [Lentinula lateritia]|nr:MAG: hypothetical protein NXY57DRAFT_1043913 [Lentinula lateritia]